MLKKLLSRKELIDLDFPFGIAGVGIPLGDPDIEWTRTNPDIVVYKPKGSGIYDGDNEHFLVFESPKEKELIAIWTQSSCEGSGDNHLVISRSKDAKNWSEPEYIIGAKYGEKGNQASWGFPIISKNGRIYEIYTRDIGIYDYDTQGCGSMGCIYSDDGGKSWSEPQDIQMQRSKFDNPDKTYPKNWIVWQKPQRDNKDFYFVGYTLITSKSFQKHKSAWINCDSRSFFMKFLNIDENPEPKDIKIQWLPDDENGIEIENFNFKDMSTSQEPSLVFLPDESCFCVFRNTKGFVYYAISKDSGHTFSKPRVLKYSDEGEKIPHPMSPCPIYKLNDGRYILIYHNNSGNRLGFSQNKKIWDNNYANFFRNPTYISYGRYDANSEQKIIFDNPIKMFDTDDIAIGPKMTAEVCTYSSVTHFNGRDILWYPDRKYFLLGKYLN